MLESLFNKLYEKETPSEYYKIFKESFFHRTPPVAALPFTTIFEIIIEKTLYLFCLL